MDRIDLRIDPRERVGLLGESGSGKSVTAVAALGLVSAPGAITGGTVTVTGIDLATASTEQLRTLRGGVVGMVFQEAASALNPVFSVGYQLAEAVRCHLPVRRQGARSRALQLLGDVGLEEPAAMYPAYPHQLSGGQIQRVMTAMALAGDPRLLIADEPTTALDVSAQARILKALRHICDHRGLALLLISHDLAVLAGCVDRTLVLFAGEVVEEAPVTALFDEPLHPYTQSLLAASRGSPPPRGAAASTGCRFAPRCDLAEARCVAEQPELVAVGRGRRVRCWLRQPGLEADK